MLTPPFTGLTKFLSARYPALGRPIKLAPMTFDFRVSNNLFEYATSGGRYLLKVMAHPQALYGQMDVRDRLEIVGRAVFELAGAGIPVEEIIPGEEQRFVFGYQSHLLRLYRFHVGRGYETPEADMPSSARALEALHQGLPRLDSETRAGIMRLDKPYPLPTTVSELPELSRFVRAEAVSRRVYGAILDQWDIVEATVRRVLDYRAARAQPTRLLHTDFHPRNALFDKRTGQATMIDLDNMIVGPYLHCLGFAILRFALFYGDRTPEALQRGIAAFAPNECGNREFLDDLLHAMLYIEIEKVLRILHRVRTTGQYAGFVDNIDSLHLPNIKLIGGCVVYA